MSAAEFLGRHGMLASRIDPDRELSRFLEEMNRVRSGGDGSLKMIPAFLGEYRTPDNREKITVIDIGGTNVRAAIVEMGPEGMLSSIPLEPFLTPGLDGEIDSDTFFHRIADGVSSQDVWRQVTAEEGSKLGICFSFALNPSKDRDAEVAYGAKQINVPDLVGRKIGDSFRKALRDLGRPAEQKITVINDAVAAALGGYSLPSEKQYSGYLGFIYGTGTNLSYCTRHGEIINVESGAYCSFPSGDIDDAYDRSLIDAGQDRFEKMVSGGYQKGLADCILRYAAQEGELSNAARRALHDHDAAGLDPKEISTFMKDPLGEGIIARSCESPEDRIFLAELFDLLTERSALLCSVTITAALLQAAAGSDPDMPAFITAEGSTFSKQKGFREKLFSAMDSLAGQKHGLHYEFHTVPDVILRGTAVACMSS